jgi:hypothetical protein
MEQSLIFNQNKNLAWQSTPSKLRSCKEFRGAQYSIGILLNLRMCGEQQLRSYEKHIPRAIGIKTRTPQCKRHAGICDAIQPEFLSIAFWIDGDFVE